MTPDVFRKTVIAPTLVLIGLDSPAAQVLLLATAIQESKLTARRQVGGGPALGLYQIEKDTHDDVWENYLKFRKPLSQKVLSLVPPKGATWAALEFNDRYATAIARICYARVSAPLPQANDIAAMSRYWETYYNTGIGLGRAEQFVDSWNSANVVL